MSAKVITPYGDYINQPNATNLDHIPGDYGWPLLGHTFSYIKDPMAWAQERYKKYGPLQRIATTGVRGGQILPNKSCWIPSVTSLPKWASLIACRSSSKAA